MSTAPTMEFDSGYEALAQQLIERKSPENQQAERNRDIREARKEEPRETAPRESKSFLFQKGDQQFEVDEDAEIEFTADKGPVKLTLREMRDRAAGDIAVKNRMHSLAEEKKKIQKTFKEFSAIAKDDPLGALEYISQRVKESDSEFEYQTYLEKLADQAEKLGKMDEKERKALELEKKLGKAEQDLSLKEREANAVLRKQEILRNFPEIGDQEFGQMVEAVLDNEDLADGLETEGQILDMVEDLIAETLTQRDIIRAISQVNPSYAKDDQLIFALSDQLRLNPDFDEDDIRDVIESVIRPSERTQAIKTLSEKNRASHSVDYVRRESGSDFDLLKEQLLERKEQERSKRR